jgi:hypothetical protein
MSYMFYDATFNQDISGWNVGQVTHFVQFRGGLSALTTPFTPPSFR